MSARPFITCKDLIEQFLADYFEGALTETQTEDFQRHLSVCDSCRAYLATYEKTMRAAQSTRNDEGEDAPEELVRAILQIFRC